MQSFEAMTLGSPSSSYPSPNSSSTIHPSNMAYPSSPNSKSRFQDNTPRLIPSYLMGDHQNRASSFSHTSPTKPSTTPTHPSTYPPNHHPSSYERPRSQHTGPPLQSLEESFFNKRTSNSLQQSGQLDSSQLHNNNNNSHFNNPNNNSLFNNNSNYNNQFNNNFLNHNTPNNYLSNKSADSFSSPVGMGRSDPMYNIRDNTAATTILQHCWITVFGFPNEATSSILQEFSALGTVLKHIIPEEGNWVHILYENNIMTRRALSRHGRVLSGSIMIGVVPCTDQSVISNDTHRHTLNNRSLNLSNAKNLDMALNGEPRKTSTGLISKTIDYVFGWS